MWIMTTRGFFSVVEKWSDREDGTVTVRARNKEDIDNLVDVLPDAIPFQEKFATDYAWRVRVPKSDWALAVARMAMDVDYSNFKDEVKRVQGAKRASVYHSIWYVLLDLEDRVRSWRRWDYDASNAHETDEATTKQTKEPADKPAKLTPKAKPKVTPNTRKRPRRKTSTPRSRQTAKRQPARKKAA